MTQRSPADHPAAASLHRSRLHERLESARSVRLTTVTAPAGYGKTTVLTEWAALHQAAWHTFTAADAGLRPTLDRLVAAFRELLPELQVELPAATGDVQAAGDAAEATRIGAVAAELCDAVAAAATEDIVLVLDDVHLIDDADPAARLLEAVCRQLPPEIHTVLVSRKPPPFAVQRLRLSGELAELGAAQLAFTAQETGALLADRLGPDADEALGDLVHAVTGGWPVAVRLAVEAVRGGSAIDARAALDSLQEHGPIFEYLAREVFDREPASTRALLRTAALFERFTPGLLAHLGHQEPGAVLSELTTRGLFVERLRRGPGWFGLTPLARTFALRQFPVADEERAGVLDRAAAWFAASGQLAEATAALAAIEAYGRIDDLLAERSSELLAEGGADAVIAAVESIPAELRSVRAWELAGDAHQVRGNWGQAMHCLQRAAGPSGVLTTGAARRMAWMHHLSGAPAEALAVVERCALDGTDRVSESLLLSCAASARWAHGDLAESEELARSAMELARACDDDAALAAAHTVFTMVAAAKGDQTAIATHHASGLAHAERCGDVLGIIRLRVNRASHLTEEGRYRDALAEIDIALPLADLTGFTTFRALALNNRGEARLGLGQLDEAADDFRAARDIYAGTGSWLAALAHGHLARVHELRGDRVLARVAYEEAIRLAEVNNTVPHLVPALAGLARLLVEERPAASEELVRRAFGCGTGFGYVSALLAAAQVALVQGDAERALSLAVQAEQLGGERGDRWGLAAALVAHAWAGSGRRAPRLLDQAVNVWREVGNPLGEVQATIARAAVLGGASGAQLAAAAAQTARRLGAGGLAEDAVAVAEECGRPSRAPVALQTLGGFRVLRHGDVVPSVAWQSKKARDLVKILISRRGRPVTRDALVELLWPDEDIERVGNRLSVALSTARSVLDPERRAGSEPCITTDSDTVRLDCSVVSVDVLEFLADAQAGLAAWRVGQADALPLLSAAEAIYRGDFLEEDPFQEWASELREEARLTYMQVAAALGDLASKAGEHVGASRYWLRILERDCYDEPSHLALVRTLTELGNHGEARRRYRTYVARMGEIGVEPRPFPGAWGRAGGRPPVPLTARPASRAAG